MGATSTSHARGKAEHGLQQNERDVNSSSQDQDSMHNGHENRIEHHRTHLLKLTTSRAPLKSLNSEGLPDEHTVAVGQIGIDDSGKHRARDRMGIQEQQKSQI